jgi:hypothetical protein
VSQKTSGLLRTPKIRRIFFGDAGVFGGESLAVFISLAAGAINVNSLNRGSMIAVGEISQPGWAQDGKNNFGNGQMFGWNIQTGIVSNVIDNDIVDNPISEIQPTTSLQTQTA